MSESFDAPPEPAPSIGAPLPDAADATPSPRRRRRWPRILGVTALVLVLVAGTALAGAYYLLMRLEGNVTTIAGVSTEQVDVRYDPVTVLVMGSDNREGANAVYGDDGGLIEGQRSDTTMLVHISADRSRALAVSIPRDTLTELPACASGGTWRVTDKFNTAFSGGGPACTAEAVEELTGVPINHAVVIDFQGFKNVVDALGGVTICLEEATDDPLSQLELPAGWSTVMGDQALAFVRTRTGLGDGSDISRIQRQQMFLSAAIRQATDRDLIRNPVKLYRMLDAATKSLSVDGGLNEIGEMRALAESLIDVEPDDVTFVTMPFVDAGDGSNVLLDKQKAAPIWQAIRNDTPYPPPPTPGANGKPLVVPPKDISVRVLNGTGVDNAATAAAADLAEVGFTIAGLDMADRTGYATTEVHYNRADAQAARTLQAAVPGSELVLDDAVAPGAVTLIVGADYSGAEPVVVKHKSAVVEDPWQVPDPITADTSLCAG